MIHNKIDLGNGAYLVTFIHKQYTQKWELNGDFVTWVPDARPSVLILPGGAYMYCSEREAEPIIFPFLTAGYNAFYLVYRTDDESVFPNPLEDVSKAIWTIRKNAEDWQCDPDKIAVGGFSAGGSVSSMIATQWHRKDLTETWDIPYGGNKPNAVILAYTPVEILEADKIPHVKLGKIFEQNPPELNTVNYVSEKTPPCFIWHTMQDETVPVKNPLVFANKCLEYNVPFELHIYQYGQHGLSLNTDLTAYGHKHPVNVETWVPLCINWLNQLFKF